MKRILVLFLSVLLLLCGCGGREAEALRLGVMYSADILPLALMKEQGMDQAHGFTLDMQVFSSAKDRDAALQAGELDGVFTDYIGVCIYQNAGLDVRITGVTDGDYLLLAAPGSGIGSLAGAALSLIHSSPRQTRPMYPGKRSERKRSRSFSAAAVRSAAASSQSPQMTATRLP